MDYLKKLGIAGNNAGAQCGHVWQSDLIDRKILESMNPATGEVIGSVALANEADVEKVMTMSQQAFLAWRNVPAPKRGELVRQMGEALREQKDALGTLVSLEMGKSKQEGDGEVQEMIDMADFAVGQSRMLYGLSMHSERPSHRMMEQWHPYGIIGVISAFNFPVAVWAWNAFLSAICGNVTVWKPSHKTPLCAIAVQNICNAVLAKNNYPAIFSYFMPSDHDLAERFVADPRVPVISFTGSTRAGKKVAQIIAERLGHSILELGGNNSIIIDETANLKLAIPAVVFGAVGTAGQRCTSTRRLFVHESRYDQVLAELKKVYAQLSIGDPLDQSHHMGPLVDQSAVDEYAAAISELKKLGAEIVYGGKVLERPGFFVEPTLVAKVQNDWDIVQRETFAPILYVMSYKTLDDAIALQNGVPQGLSSALFTSDLIASERFLSVAGSDCGIANVNIGTSGAEIGGAFGGEKDTGGGREAGSDAWKAYMRRQTNTINWGATLPLAQGIKFAV